jgi:hypothetical protein
MGYKGEALMEWIGTEQYQMSTRSTVSLLLVQEAYLVEEGLTVPAPSSSKEVEFLYLVVVLAKSN